MQTSGLILDIYDDYRGDTLRSLFPSRSEIPDLVKQAHALSGEERSHLPDDAFALVLINGDETLRKYACIDAGNTALSVMFFLKNGHKLPEEAQKTAAANLAVACEWYELPSEGLEKIALIGWAAKQAIEHPWAAFNTAMTAPGVAHEVAANNRAITEIHKERGDGTFLGQHVLGSPISPDQIKEHLKQGSMNPYVNVTDLEAKGEVTIKEAKHYALGDKYPLDSYAQIKTASEYFDEYATQLEPEQRREYCVNLIKRAEALDISVSEQVRHYGGDVFAPPDMLKTAHDMRVRVLNEPQYINILDALFEKAAELGPDLFADTLSEFDRTLGLHHLYDKDIQDPYYSTFYKQAAQEYSWIDGNDMVTENQLHLMAMSDRHTMKKVFSEDMIDEFCKDPVGIFKSLPLIQKKVIARMASDDNSGTQSVVLSYE